MSSSTLRQPAQSSPLAATLQMLVRLRAAAGISQTTLADRLGVSQSDISKFERGERKLDERRLREWLRALDVTDAALPRTRDQMDSMSP